MKTIFLQLVFLVFAKSLFGQVSGTSNFLIKGPNPQVFTLSSKINDTSSAILTGQIIDNSLTAITEIGFLWGTSTPTITSYSGISTKSEAGTITSTMNGLQLGNTYYAVTYAKNNDGIFYSNVIILKWNWYVISPKTNKIWMAYNLGATDIPKTANDTAGYGYTYQWGRSSDGHQYRTSGTTSTLSSSDNPNNGLFITNNITPYDWRNPNNDNLWQGLLGINNPCPNGFRVPTTTEIYNESIKDPFNSFLKLPSASYRSLTGGYSGNNSWILWTSTVSDTNAIVRRWDNSTSLSTPFTYQRGCGIPIRCILN
jgi:uncharacterized protein (TIGR02145 family)